MNKFFKFTEQDIECINSIKETYQISTDVGAIRFALKKLQEKTEEEEKEKRMAEQIANLILDKNYAFNERLRWATRTAEQNSILLLDAVNTLLFQQKIDTCIPVASVMSPVIETSQQQMKERIAHFKQMKDDRMSKDTQKK